MSRPAPATSSAASSAQPPAKTESARSTRCSSWSRRSYGPRDRRPESALASSTSRSRVVRREALGESLADRVRESDVARGCELDRSGS